MILIIFQGKDSLIIRDFTLIKKEKNNIFLNNITVKLQLNFWARLLFFVFCSSYIHIYIYNLFPAILSLARIFFVNPLGNWSLVCTFLITLLSNPLLCHCLSMYFSRLSLWRFISHIAKNASYVSYIHRRRVNAGCLLKFLRIYVQIKEYDIYGNLIGCVTVYYKLLRNHI